MWYTHTRTANWLHDAWTHVRRSVEPMPKDLPQAVHTALRRWYTGKQQDAPWRSMLVTARRLGQQPVPDFSLAVNEVLLEALNTLDAQASNTAAQILRLRFLDGLTAKATANRLNLTEDTVSKRQRGAVNRLAGIVWQSEQLARSARAADIESKLEIQHPPRLFGVRDKLLDLRSALEADGPPWLVAVVGIGGIGKTSLADAVVRTLATSLVFSDIGWVSARQDRFTLWDGLQPVGERTPILTTEGLLDAVLQQCELRDVTQLPQAERRAAVRARLKAQPFLIVVDNLETAADFRALIPDLQSLANPTRFLVTSRDSLHEYPGVYNLVLDELSADDSLALLRHEADERGLIDVSRVSDEILLQVHEVSGGNPLALKLLIGQMHALSLPTVVEGLRQALGRTVEELYCFIYWRAWNLLTQEARQVLAIMPLVADSGGGLDQIAELSRLAQEPLTTALRQLVNLCLVNARGTVDDRRYSIHRLTETFLLNQVVKWRTIA
jgi:hypothetical protein